MVANTTCGTVTWDLTVEMEEEVVIVPVSGTQGTVMTVSTMIVVTGPAGWVCGAASSERVGVSTTSPGFCGTNGAQRPCR